MCAMDLCGPRAHMQAGVLLMSSGYHLLLSDEYWWSLQRARGNKRAPETGERRRVGGSCLVAKLY